jgi:putative salt-induced outer membrane protein YdiY
MSFIRRAAALCALAYLGLSMAWADQVVLKNGDRITGSIVKKDGKNLTIKSDLFGVVTLAWDQVVSVQADKPLNLGVPGGKTVQGTIATANGKLEIATKETKLSVDPGDITTIRNDEEEAAYERLQHPGWRQLWAGTASVGFAGASGNAQTLTFTTGVTAARVTNTDKTSLYFNTIKASALANGKNSDTAQAVRGGVGYDHNVSSRLFVNMFNDWEYDKFQNLDLRIVLGGGFGFHAVKTMRSQLDVLGGFDYNRSKFTTPPTQSSGEVFFGDQYNLKVSAGTALVQSFRIFEDVSDSSAYRANADIGINTKIAKWLTWNVSVSDRYLHNPAPGRKTNDLLYSTGLGITFSR